MMSWLLYCEIEYFIDKCRNFYCKFKLFADSGECATLFWLYKYKRWQY